MRVEFEAYWSIGAQEIQPRISRMTRMGRHREGSGRLKADRGLRLPYFQGAGDRHEERLRCIEGGEYGGASGQERLHRVAGREVEADEGLADFYASADLEQAQADGVELGAGQLGRT